MLSRADRAEALTIEDGVVRWAGPSDPERDAPILRFEGTLEEGEEIGDLVARCAMPATLVAELAERFVDVSLDVGDPRWRRALAAVRIARGEPIATTEVSAFDVIVPGQVHDVRVLPDGTVVAVRTGALHIGDRVIAIESHEKVTYVLPRPLATDPMMIAVAIFIWEPRLTKLFVFDRDGAQIASAAGVTSNVPREFTRGAKGWWLHTSDSLTCLGAEAAIEEHRLSSFYRAIVGRRLVATGDKTLCAIALDGDGAAIQIAWPSIHGFAGAADHVVVTNQEGAWRWDLIGEPVRVCAGPMWGVTLDGDRMWLGSGTNEVIALERGVERWRAPLPHITAYSVTRVCGGVLANDHTTAIVFDDAGGQLVAVERGRVSPPRALPDGTFALNAGEQVCVIDPQGVVARALPMPYDGGFASATTHDRFIFGRAGVHVDYARFDGLHAVDRRGIVTSKFPGDYELRDDKLACDATHAYVIDKRGLVRWDPRGVTGVVPPPPRVPTQRGITSLGPETVNPRDDWAVIGIEIHNGNFLALDGNYGGSTGFSYEVPLRVTDGAIATFVRCDLTVGAPGDIARRASTVILVECVLPADHEKWRIEADCHLVRIDCTVAPQT